MSWDHVKADWQRAKAKIKAKWVKLSDSDLAWIDGDWDRLIHKLRELYGLEQEHAEREATDFVKKG